MLMTLMVFFGSLLSYAADEEVQSANESKYVMSHSLGMSESLGFFGLYTGTLAREYGRTDLFLSGGTTALIFGGVGAGVKHDFLDSWFTPYISAATTVDYMLPMMCQNCRSIALFMFLNGSMGVELRTTQGENFNFHLLAGVWSSYSLSDGELLESPSDRPGIWPVLNLKLSHRAR